MSTAGISTDTSPKLVTAEELFRDYSAIRCDLIDGKVYEMAPPGFGHGTIEVRVAQLLDQCVRERGLGLVVSGDAGFLASRNPDTVLGADVAFVRKERIDTIGVPEKYFPEAPALAVEITSPSDSADEVDDKVRRWLAAGSEAVWVVYSRGRTVTVYRSQEEVQVLTGDEVLDGGETVPGFSHPVSELFPGTV